MNTPRVESDTRHIASTTSTTDNLTRVNKKLAPIKKVTPLEYDSDIDPDDLLPVYLESKTKLFELQSSTKEVFSKRRKARNDPPKSQSRQITPDPESAKLLRKIKKIEDDVLFDKYLASQQWEARRVQLEKDAASHRHALETALDNNDQSSETLVDSDDEVSREAAKMGEDLLADTGSDDDTALADLFASLPVSEVDPLTGKNHTVVNGPNGVKVFIRDFGKWTGVNPTRVLEEACRARKVPSPSSST